MPSREQTFVRERRRKTLALTRMGRTANEIAVILDVTRRTVERYRNRARAAA